MALPKQVQAQVDALAEFEKQVAAGNTPADEPKPNENPPADPAPNPNPQPTEPAPAEPPKPVEDADKWRQRYLSLQGQYNTQVPALQDQVRQLTDMVTKLTAKLEQPAQATPPEPSELVTTKDVEAFGEDLVDLARRIAKEEFGKRETKYLQKIDALEGQLATAKGQVDNVAQSQVQTANDRFFEGLAKAIPTWEQVQATAECQEFLTTRVPGTRATWDQALKQAAAERDVDAVVEVFDVFFEKHPALNPKAKQQHAATAKQELNRQVAPGKSTATATPTQGKRTYSQQEFSTEYDRVTTLFRSGQRDEASRLEKELDAALSEGRVR